MRELTPFERIVYNDGERLIFGVSHGIDEDIRHRSSYLFFRKVIEFDKVHSSGEIKKKTDIRIIDLGCGVGHGCKILAQISDSIVIGVDVAKKAIEYANTTYSGQNITYVCRDLVQYVPTMSLFDYVVSRGVFEHMPDGLNLASFSKWSKRLMFDVPYNEPAGANPHHVLSNITERDFMSTGAEFFYQDLNGIIYDEGRKPVRPNMIICVYSHPTLHSVVNSGIEFPIPAWQP